MKIIDHTPYFDQATGEISFQDRLKAMLKYGPGWIKDVEAQKQVIAVIGKVLDRNFTLLRNVTPPGLDASFPFILVGPTGVFFMYVTHLNGVFRAKGDQWGTISGSSFKNEKINLLTRTERMARAIQVYLQRQGHAEVINVEAILLCSDPSVHVDSIRPIIRVVMRDALERFAISVTQARAVLSPDSVQKIINHILKPPAQPQPGPAVSPTADILPAPPFAPVEEPQLPSSPIPASNAPPWSKEPDSPPVSPASPRPALNKKQWAFLIVMFILWCLLITVFLFLVIRDQSSLLLSLLP